MATVSWRGGAVAVAQVQSYTFGGTWEADDVVRIVIGSKTVDITGGSATINTAIDTVVTAFNALDAEVYPEFAEITASRSSSNLVLTGETKGLPFVATITPLEANLGAADSQTIEGGTSATTGTASTACSGPNHWSTAANWSGGAVPSSTDDVVIENSDVDILYGLAQSAVTLASLTVAQSYTGKIGLARRNASAYYEYRDQYLAISATAVSLGRGEGNGSGRIKLDTGSNAATVNILNSGPQEETGVPAILWKGTHSSDAVNILKGTLGIAYFAGETANVSGGLKLGAVSSPESDAAVWCGSGVTIATVDKNGGYLETNSAVTTGTNRVGEWKHQSAAFTTLVVQGGNVRYNSTGTLGTATVAESGHLDFDQDPRAKTVTNPVEMYGDDSKFSDRFGVVGSLVLDLNQRSTLAGISLKTNARITLGTPA